MESKERYNRKEIVAIPEPMFTKTWHPTSHRRVIGAMDQAIETAGIGLRDESYSTTNGGKNMFASWTLDIPFNGGERFMQIGFRNSLMKTFAVGVCSGNYVVVCSNMCFSGDFVDFHKHTSGLNDDRLIELTAGAVNNVIEKGNQFDNWHQGLLDVPVPNDDFKVLTFDALDKGLVGANRFKSFLDNYTEEFDLHGDNLYSFHGAVTRQIRQINLFSISQRTNLLNGMCDDYRALKAA